MLRINVEQKHINTGFRGLPNCNPIALAIREQLIPHPMIVNINPWAITINNETIYNDYELYELIKAYNLGEKMVPFSFNLPYAKQIEAVVVE